jgi:3-methylfumaryl-CoA hydratase
MDNFDAWIGRSRERHDQMDPWRASSLAASLGSHPASDPPGTLPCLWHWLYFLDAPEKSTLAQDGHARRGDFMPPIDLERRMFAGGRNTVHQPLRLGVPAKVTETVMKVEHKPAAGLYVVTVGFNYVQDGVLCVAEERDLIFIGGKPAVPPPGPMQPVEPAAWSQDIVPDEVLLFRYSALTFNSHRIHYDRTYVQDTEGYPDIVVHGPLSATLLVELARVNGGKPVTHFAFRAQQPVYVNNTLRLRGAVLEDGSLDLKAYAPNGKPAMSATARF